MLTSGLVITTQANAELNQVKLRRFRDALQRSKYAARGDVFHVIDDPDEAKKVRSVADSYMTTSTDTHSRWVASTIPLLSTNASGAHGTPTAP
jgi:hypothetical protein